MNYYSFHIGDYRRDTAHLSLLEHGVYRQLLDWFYLDEKPIPKETDVVFRRLCARTDDEKGAVIIVLQELFELTENGYIQTRCMGEIATYQGQAARARGNGKLGGRPPKTTVVIDGLSEKTKTKANQEPITKNQQPLTTNHLPLTKEDQNLLSPPATPKADPIPYQKVVDLYHQTLPTLPKVVKLSAKRKSQIGARWRSGDIPDLETWQEYFEFVSRSDWLMGKVEPSNGRKRFVADLEWLTNESNFIKTWENKYHGR